MGPTKTTMHNKASLTLLAKKQSLNLIELGDEEGQRMSMEAGMMGRAGVKSKSTSKNNSATKRDTRLQQKKQGSNKYTDIMSIEVTNYSLFDDGEDILDDQCHQGIDPYGDDQRQDPCIDDTPKQHMKR